MKLLWPAPAAAPAWNRLPARCHRPAAPIPARTPPPARAAAPERTRTPPANDWFGELGPSYVIGLAMTFGRLFRPTCDTLPGLRVQVEPGAFDGWLARVAAGEKAVGLWVDHAPGSELCSTADGSLQVRVAGDELHFRVRPVSAAGRRAVTAAKAGRGRREASTGIQPTEYVLDEPPGLPPMMLIYEAELREISLVGRGAFPGTCVLVA